MTSDLSVRLSVVEVELARLRAVLDAGGPDRLLGLPEAARRIGMAPYTLRAWLEDASHPMHRSARRAFSKLGRRWKTDTRRMEQLAASQCSTVRGNGK